MKLRSTFSNARLLRLLIFISLGLQLIVLSQMYFFKADLFSEPLQVIVRLLRGTVLTFFGGAILSYPFIGMIRFLNKKMPWRRHTVKRFLIQFPIAVMGGLLVTPLILLPASWFFGLESDFATLVNNAFYLVILSLFLMIVLEAVIYFDENAESQLAARKLQDDLIREASDRARVETQILMEEEKNRLARDLIDQEKKLSRSLELEIQKREKISLELEESRGQLQSILSNLAGAAYRCLFDDDYTMKYISDKIFDITGYHASDFKDNNIRTFASIIHPDDTEHCRNSIMQASSSKTRYEFEYRLIHRDGSTVWVNENGKSVYDSDGNLSYLDGIIVDITRRKEAELSANESEKKYKELMDFLPQPVFELNLQGEIILSNKAGDEFFGTLPDDPDAKLSALDCFVKEDIPRIIDNFKKSAQGIKTEPGEFTAIKKDGSLCPVMVFGNPIMRNGEIVGRRGIIIDISERKKQEMGLLKAKEELERMNNTLEQSVAERTKQLTEANTQLLKVQKENLQSQFEVLKQQVNPHFLFNSLNVLTSLIKIDPDLAESFTERLSKVYRYVLENKEKDLVSLSTELEFLNAYLFLLEIRFMNKIFIEINIDKSYYDFQILPIAIQLLIENAIKHNTFSKVSPLKIELYVDRQNRLNIVNNLNARETKFASTGVGLENISRRYALVSDRSPEFTRTKDQFIARLPLLKSENE
jgi:PAS domain S-box-containing protein